jgi:hypothetical protein
LKKVVRVAGENADLSRRQYNSDGIEATHNVSNSGIKTALKKPREGNEAKREIRGSDPAM